MSSYYHEIHKINQCHRVWVVARVAKDRVRVLGTEARSKILDGHPHYLPTSGGLILRPLRIWAGD